MKKVKVFVNFYIDFKFSVCLIVWNSWEIILFIIWDEIVVKDIIMIFLLIN